MKNNNTIQVSSLIRAKPWGQDEKSSVFDCHPASGYIYIMNNFLSGHVRVRARPNGQYPYHYKEMINNIFGASNNAIEVCSNSITANSLLTTVDINPKTNPSYIADGQAMPFENETFDRWYCDPPYNQANALKMYNTKLPSRQKLLKEGARVVKKGSLLFFLLGAVNYQVCPPELERTGMIFITVVPNNEIRTCNIYCKKL